MKARRRHIGTEETSKNMGKRKETSEDDTRGKFAIFIYF